MLLPDPVVPNSPESKHLDDINPHKANKKNSEAADRCTKDTHFLSTATGHSLISFIYSVW